MGKRDEKPKITGIVEEESLTQRSEAPAWRNLVAVVSFVTISFLIGELMKHVLYKAALGRTKKF
jgi:hypothetical protein